MASETKRLARMEAGGEKAQSAAVRALFVSASGELGGAERSLLELLQALPPERVRAQVGVPPDSVLARLCALSGIPAHPVIFRRFRRTLNLLLLAGQVRAINQGATTLTALCRTQQFQLLHGNTDSAAIVLWETHRRTGVPFVWHCRDMRPLHGCASILAGAAAAVVPISKAVEQHLLREKVPAEKIQRIDNGIDLTRIPEPEARAEVRARTRAALGIGSDCPVVLAVGAYVPWKRHEVFLRALAQLRQRFPKLVGLLAGSDQFHENSAYEQSLQLLIRQLSLKHGDSVQLLGEREDVPQLLAAADVLISTSDNEPFGRVLAEAGAAGLPVVSTASGGKQEIVEDGLTGILTPSGDAEALVAATARLLSDAKLAAQMGCQARRRVAQHFDIKRTAAEFAALVERIVRN